MELMDDLESIGEVKLNLKYYKGSDEYSDGDEIEERILQIVKEESGYEYCHKDFASWPVLYHLSRQRENIVEPMEIDDTDDVLEIGAGMGAVTGALARRAKSVTCIELSKRRSMVNAYRHRDIKNIEIVVGNFQDIPIDRQYDVVTLIGVFEYASHYIRSKEPYSAFLQQIKKCLKPNGKLYIAIENKLGMKYFAGYNEDHLGKPFCGIEGYSKEDMVKTFTKSQIENLLLKNGFVSPVFYYPFPDYKLPTVIYDEEMLKHMKVDYAGQFNYDADAFIIFDQNKAFESLSGSEETSVLSNSFFIEAVKE